MLMYYKLTRSHTNKMTPLKQKGLKERRALQDLYRAKRLGDFVLFWAAVGLIIGYLWFIIGLKWFVNAWEWFPIVILTFWVTLKFRPNVGPWLPYVLQKYI